MAERKRIVVAGGGFGGVRAALDLAWLLPSEKITLINNTRHHVYHADLYELAGTVLEKENKISFERVEGTVNIPLEQIFKDKNIEVVVDKIESVDLPGKFLMAKENGTVKFDYLVLALGSDTNFFGVRGAQDYSHQFKTVEDALNVRDDLEEKVRNSNSPVSVVIAGGGFTGTELTASLVWFARKLSKKYQKPQPEITVLEGSDSILGGMPRWAQQKSLNRLKKLRVKVLLGHRISSISEGSLDCEEGESFKYDYLIWTTGIQGSNLGGRIKGVEFNKKGQIHTEQDMSVKDYPEIFVIGDLVECMDIKRSCPTPATAWAAIGQAEIAAKNIKHRILEEPLVYYTPPDPVFVVPVGGRFTLYNFLGLQITGFPGWIFKRLVALKYFFSILPIWDAIKIWREGVKIYSKNDEN